MPNPIIKQTSVGDVYATFSVTDLQELGKEENPNMYMGSGILFCLNCEDYALHSAMSTKGMSDCFPICSACKRFSTTLDKAVRRGLINKPGSYLQWSCANCHTANTAADTNCVSCGYRRI